MKRTAESDLPAPGVSTAVRRVCGRGEVRPAWPDSHVKRLSALRNARRSLQQSLRSAKNDARRGALEAAKAACVAGRTSQAAVAVLLHMRAGAAAGDRRDAFAATLNAMEAAAADKKNVRMIVLEAAWHGTVPAAIGALEGAWSTHETGRPPDIVLVAVLDADRFPETVIRDIVYICGTKHAQALRSEGSCLRVVLLLGVGISGDGIHAALGTTESTMIAPVPVFLPPSEICFHAVVSRVLDGGKSPVILSSEAFALLRSEFVRGNASMSMVERALECIFTMQFHKHDLIAVFSDSRVLPSFFQVERKQQGETSTDDEGSEALNLWRKDLSTILKKAITLEMAVNLASAKACPSFANAASSDWCKSALDWEEFVQSKEGLRMPPEELQEECQKVIDAQAIRDFALDCFERLCFWRWTWGLLQTVTKRVVEEMGLADEASCGAHAWGGILADAELEKMRLHTALYEQSLPDRRQVEYACAQNEASSSVENHLAFRRKSLFHAVRRMFLKLSVSQLLRVLKVWIGTLREFLSQIGSALCVKMLPLFIGKLEELRATMEEHTGSQVERMTTASGPDSLEAGGAASADAGKSGSMRKVRDKNRGTSSSVDAALKLVETGIVEFSSRTRASGAEAMRARRRETFAREAVKSRATSGPLSEARAKARDLFDEMLQFAPPLHSLPLHEFLMFSDVDQLRAVLGSLGCQAEPRRTLVASMRHPDLHFGDLEERDIPDIALSYQLLAEGGHVVNVSDWCNTYVSLRASARAPVAPVEAVVPSDGDVTGKPVDDDPTERAQAEFAHCVPELEFLGVLKHTNRRTDHVLRMMYE